MLPADDPANFPYDAIGTMDTLLFSQYILKSLPGELIVHYCPNDRARLSDALPLHPTIPNTALDDALPIISYVLVLCRVIKQGGNVAFHLRRRNLYRDGLGFW